MRSWTPRVWAQLESGWRSQAPNLKHTSQQNKELHPSNVFITETYVCTETTLCCLDIRKVSNLCCTCYSLIFGLIFKNSLIAKHIMISVSDLNSIFRLYFSNLTSVFPSGDYSSVYDSSTSPLSALFIHLFFIATANCPLAQRANSSFVGECFCVRALMLIWHFVSSVTLKTSFSNN